MPEFGGYPVADVLDVGDEVSSDGEGRTVTLLESDLIHPTHTDGFADKGDPVVFGTTGLKAVGISKGSAIAATDRLAVDTEGLYGVDVVAVNDAGNSLVSGGDLLYINVATGVVSKISDQATQIPYGIAFGIVTAGETNTIAVKIHYDPSLVNSKRTYFTVTSGAYIYGRHHTSILAAGQSTGLEYFDQQVNGVQTGGIYGFGTWLELGATFVDNGSLLVCHEIGLYDGGATLTSARVVLQQMQAILASTPGTSLHLWRVNVAAAGGAITSMFTFANPTSAGLVLNALETSTVVGHIPFAEVVGLTGVGWIRLYDGPT